MDVGKTKKMVVEFRISSYYTFKINEEPVQKVTSFRYLRIHITQDLTGSFHTQHSLKEARERLYLS